MRLPTVVHRLESCRKFTFSPLSCFWDKLVKVVTLFTEFHVYRKFDVDTRLYLTFHLLMNALNSFNSVRSFYSAVTSTVVSKGFSANHSTSLSQAYLSLFVIGPIVLDQRQCLGLSLIWTAWQMSDKKNLNAERTLWMDAGHALQIQGVNYFSLDSKFICFAWPWNIVFYALQPWSHGLEISFYTHFAPPHPCAMLTKHIDLTQVCIWLFSNSERANGGAGTYSIGITVMSSCFCNFVHGCLSFHIF